MLINGEKSSALLSFKCLYRQNFIACIDSSIHAYLNIDIGSLWEIKLLRYCLPISMYFNNRNNDKLLQNLQKQTKI